MRPEPQLCVTALGLYSFNTSVAVTGLVLLIIVKGLRVSLPLDFLQSNTKCLRN